ncbi:MAG: CPBP family intramembrane glutamic endopeptidase [Coriobacteriia bacterium]|jgi:membrane protease YdiL (CAAX protease family)|nr:CPBP family intramembrane glutamic endopeptidase [Coriobacteriia bacterium]
MWLEWLGLQSPSSWPATIALSLTWLAMMLVLSPLADRLASALVSEPPRLEAFRVIQRGWGSLAVGIAVSWLLGGFIEEIALRGIVVRHMQTRLAPWIGSFSAAIVAVLLAALVAGIVHLYQGARGGLIVAQLSVLFGMLYVVSGYNLWTAIICHGCYDTIAFVRFARRSSKYSDLSGESGSGDVGPTHRADGAGR